MTISDPEETRGFENLMAEKDRENASGCYQEAYIDKPGDMSPLPLKMHGQMSRHHHSPAEAKAPVSASHGSIL